MVSRKVVASLLLVSLLAEQTQGFMPFFTQSDFQKMQLQEKERNKAGQKKSLSSLQQLEEEGFSEQSSVDVGAAKTLQQALPARAWLTPRQLEKYQDVLEKLLAELLQDTPDGTVRGLISALGILPFLLLTSSSAQRYLYSPEGFLCHVCSLCGALRSQLLLCAPFWEGYFLVRCCLCPRADIDWKQQHNPSQQPCLPLPCSSSS
ncbi:promotilin-like isoform X1 [Vidua chalybeata]|uniref:promotilin-like isoform X1 n=1 Tax=Vidua chalybeata TaxID=81927 RepID=UPI0023A7C2D8|nr:promotilin-like isoform X1 [Vidua chalybeata]